MPRVGTLAPSSALLPFEREVRKALEFGAFSPQSFEDLSREIDEGRAQVWAGLYSVLITKVVDTPTGRELEFVIAAGLPGKALPELPELSHAAMVWGAWKGCERATFVGRRGWERTFLTRDDGWEPRYTVFFKDLSNGQGKETTADAGI